MKGERMKSFLVWFAILAISLAQVHCAKKTPDLSARPPLSKPALLNSYLPPAMQVLAHFTNQMKFERPEMSTVGTAAQSTTTKPTTTRTTTTTTTTTTTAPTTAASPDDASTTPQPQKDEESPTTPRQELTTPPHAPGNYAPITPPRPRISDFPQPPPVFDSALPPIFFNDRSYPVVNSPFLPEILPYDSNLPLVYNGFPLNPPFFTRNDFPLESPNIPIPLFPSNTYFPAEPQLEFFEPNPFHVPGIQYPQPNWYDNGRIGEEVINPYGIVPDISSLPVANENNFKYNPLEVDADELSDENLQYLAPTVREMLQGLHQTKQLNTNGHPVASYQSIEDLFDNTSDRQDVSDWLRLRKAPTNQSLIQMLLLYDLLSRDAKKQKLNNYNGYTPEILKDLVDTSQGTAIDQLRVVLERMVARGDCTHDFANNRAKDMVADLGKPDSRLSKELRYLEPLRYME